MVDNELGSFLRAGREALSPAGAGLPDGERRRTPGLRRSELAVLAGVSVEYLIRLEQGRDRRPSAEVLMALADALRMTAEERVHLLRLSKVASGAVCEGMSEPPRDVRPSVRALLDRLGDTPAFVRNGLDDVLAASPGFERWARPLGLFDAPGTNLARYVFTDPRAREAYPDWDAVADHHVRVLRTAVALGDPYAAALAAELEEAAPAFAHRFRYERSLAPGFGDVRWHRPGGGELRLTYEDLELPGGDGLRMVVHLPADQETERALADRDAAAPAR
ncbi:helix-turn-helix protein [Nocardiopsis sp. Huas11]|uniref:helix-turn-helix domain-containing protein n=1 Tax=Nocardiopsis sp. Huas11 TaxID=2183912 RepID=UPI000EB0EB8D|nr:helix-turn-helix transcriptional regulator [Nocardiopsis sp. Huas11]RKS07814.1 helix-turn-helix protein [Nocardiopsis sp. Huas11]